MWAVWPRGSSRTMGDRGLRMAGVRTSSGAGGSAGAVSGASPPRRRCCPVSTKVLRETLQPCRLWEAGDAGHSSWRRGEGVACAGIVTAGGIGVMTLSPLFSDVIASSPLGNLLSEGNCYWIN